MLIQIGAKCISDGVCTLHIVSCIPICILICIFICVLVSIRECADLTSQFTHIVQYNASHYNSGHDCHMGVITFQETPPATLEFAKRHFNDDAGSAEAVIEILLCSGCVNVVSEWLH